MPIGTADAGARATRGRAASLCRISRSLRTLFGRALRGGCDGRNRCDSPARQARDRRGWNRVLRARADRKRHARGAVRRSAARGGSPAEARLHPPEFLHEWLSHRDPARAARLHARDAYRVVRALEIALVGRERRAAAAADACERRHRTDDSFSWTFRSRRSTRASRRVASACCNRDCSRKPNGSARGRRGVGGRISASPRLSARLVHSRRTACLARARDAPVRAPSARVVSRRTRSDVAWNPVPSLASYGKSSAGLRRRRLSCPQACKIRFSPSASAKEPR